MVDEYAEQQLQRGIDIQQHAGQRDGNAVHARREEQQRHGGRRARQQQEQHFPARHHAGEQVAARCLGIDQIGQRKGRDIQRFHRQRHDAVHAKVFLHRAVDGKAPADAQRQQRRLARLHHRDEHADERNGRGRPLEFGHPLMEHRPPQQDRQQRADVVRQACVEDMAAAHRVDIQPPVDGDRQPAGRQPPAGFSVAQRAEQRAAAPQDEREQRAEQHRHHDAHGEQIDRIHRGKLLPEHREQAPENITDRNKPCSLFQAFPSQNETNAATGIQPPQTGFPSLFKNVPREWFPSICRRLRAPMERGAPCPAVRFAGALPPAVRHFPVQSGKARFPTAPSPSSGAACAAPRERTSTGPAPWC